MNQMAKDNKILAQLMGRSTFTIPENIFALKVLDFRAMSDRQRRNIANDEVDFADFMKGLNYTRYKKQTSEQFKKSMEDLTAEERLDIVNDVWIKAQDYITNDIHQMISLKRIADLYEKNKDTLTEDVIMEIFNEVENVIGFTSTFKSDSGVLETNTILDEGKNQEGRQSKAVQVNQQVE